MSRTTTPLCVDRTLQHWLWPATVRITVRPLWTCGRATGTLSVLTQLRHGTGCGASGLAARWLHLPQVGPSVAPARRPIAREHTSPSITVGINRDCNGGYGPALTGGFPVAGRAQAMRAGPHGSSSSGAHPARWRASSLQVIQRRSARRDPGALCWCRDYARRRRRSQNTAADHLDGTRLRWCPPDRATRDKCSRPPEVLLAHAAKLSAGDSKKEPELRRLRFLSGRGHWHCATKLAAHRDHRSIKLCTGSLPPSV
jgi:hypothetical protein